MVAAEGGGDLRILMLLVQARRHWGMHLGNQYNSFLLFALMCTQNKGHPSFLSFPNACILPPNCFLKINNVFLRIVELSTLSGIIIR